MRTGQNSTSATDNTSAAAAPPAEEETHVRREPGPSDEPTFTRGMTFRHVLRAHELIRRFGWKHLIAPR